MAVGAKDYIDQMLVKRYAKEQTTNPEDAQILKMSSDKYWEIMKEVAQVHKTMVQVATAAKKVVKKDERAQESQSRA